MDKGIFAGDESLGDSRLVRGLNEVHLRLARFRRDHADGADDCVYAVFLEGGSKGINVVVIYLDLLDLV